MTEYVLCFQFIRIHVSGSVICIRYPFGHWNDSNTYIYSYFLIHGIALGDACNKCLSKSIIELYVINCTKHGGVRANQFIILYLDLESIVKLSVGKVIHTLLFSGLTAGWSRDVSLWYKGRRCHSRRLPPSDHSSGRREPTGTEVKKSTNSFGEYFICQKWIQLIK